jgi:hypothetical protein
MNSIILFILLFVFLIYLYRYYTNTIAFLWFLKELVVLSNSYNALKHCEDQIRSYNWFLQWVFQKDIQDVKALLGDKMIRLERNYEL